MSIPGVQAFAIVNSKGEIFYNGVTEQLAIYRERAMAEAKLEAFNLFGEEHYDVRPIHITATGE